MAAEFEVQKALYLAVAGLGLRTHDMAPQATDGGAEAVFPYVEVGAIVLAAWDTASETGFDGVARLHTRSRAAGMMECKDIQGAVYARLHRGVLAVTGYRTVTIQRQTSFCDRVEDGQFHGVCEYRVLIEKI